MSKNREKSPGGSQRQLRVGETVRHAVADILSQGNVHDPDLEGRSAAAIPMSCSRRSRAIKSSCAARSLTALT
jgi:ribosome-binding factor A